MDCLMIPRMTYVLALRDNKYYVGITWNLNHRYAEHMQGRGARWTRMHQPVKILSVEPGDHENDTTIRLMREKGWQNVRGGKYCQLQMPAPPPELLEDSSQSPSHSSSS